MNFRIRDAEPRDMDELVRLLRDFADQPHSDRTADALMLRAGVFGPVPKAFALIAEDTTTASPITVGFALWRYSFDARSGRAGIYLHDLHLEASHRGRGIALAFFRTLARRAINEDCAQLQWSSLVRNAPAVSLYQSLSAIPSAAWTSQKLAGETLRALAG